MLTSITKNMNADKLISIICNNKKLILFGTLLGTYGWEILSHNLQSHIRPSVVVIKITNKSQLLFYASGYYFCKISSFLHEINFTKIIKPIYDLSTEFEKLFMTPREIVNGYLNKMYTYRNANLIVMGSIILSTLVIFMSIAMCPKHIIDIFEPIDACGVVIGIIMLTLIGMCSI